MKAVLILPSGPFLQDAIVSLVDKPAERKDMHRTTTVMLRTYLRTASAMAGIIQVGAIGAIVFLRIPASAMESSGFRVWALAGISSARQWSGSYRGWPFNAQCKIK